MRGPDDILPLVHQLKERIADAYGERFAGLRLYGSYARGEAREDSDVDLLVLLHGEVDRWAEIDRLVDLSHDLELETGEIFSLLPRSVEEFESGESFFFRNVHRDALAL